MAKCNACREPFTVNVGTLYERSKIPLNKWLAATHLMMASKKGMSALEIARALVVEEDRMVCLPPYPRKLAVDQSRIARRRE